MKIVAGPLVKRIIEGTSLCVNELFSQDTTPSPTSVKGPSSPPLVDADVINVPSPNSDDTASVKVIDPEDSAVNPLMEQCVSLANKIQGLSILLYRPIFDGSAPVTPPEDISLEEYLGESLKSLTLALLDILVLPMIREDPAIDSQESIEEPQLQSSVQEAPVNAKITFPTKKNKDEENKLAVRLRHDQELQDTKEMLALRTLRLLTCLCRYGMWILNTI